MLHQIRNTELIPCVSSVFRYFMPINAYGTRLSEMRLCILVCLVPVFCGFIASESPEPLPIVLCNR